MRVVSVVGYKGVGKTTLVEDLIPALSEHGRVCTVKSIHHDVSVDEPGTDTDRHREAGAETVVGVGPSTTFDVRTRGKQDGSTLEDVLDRLDYEGYDFAVVEGFKDRELPAIVVGPLSDGDFSGTAIYRCDERTDVDVSQLVERILDLPAWTHSGDVD